MTKIRFAASFAIFFGGLTLLTGGSTLFAGLDMGAVVPFVLWFNFLAGFAYVLAGIGLILARPWAVWLAAGIAVTTALVALGFAVHVLQGKPFEVRTVGALILRCGVWVWITLVARGAQRSVT
ncbi:hypothetical protein [Shimia sediminis]|uniref:hypothetical protein n=1 Tax=Shimia sediminis TaxID=2497945 RepID=UPI000F8E8BF8|nr:hypothetical protein [Shimia sediminis]